MNLALVISSFEFNEISELATAVVPFVAVGSVAPSVVNVTPELPRTKILAQYAPLGTVRVTTEEDTARAYCAPPAVARERTPITPSFHTHLEECIQL
jgi:hypothetical protein